MASAADASGNATIWGSGFGSYEMISLTIGGFSTPIGNANANSNGAFSTTISVNLVDGVYTLRATGSDGSETTAPLVVGAK